MKLLQFTDLHLFTTPDQSLRGVNTYDSWQAVIAHAQQHHADAAAILLTGDLSQDETLASYVVLNTTLAKFTVPIYWLPGNHDNAELLLEALTLPLIQSDKVIQLGQWQIILLNSQLPNSSLGLLSTQEMNFLQQQLTSQAATPTLIALHHHVLPVGSDMDSIMLDNAEEFLQIIESHPQVKAVVSGHVHQQWQQQEGNIQFFTTPSTCYQLTPYAQKSIVDPIPPGYRWFELTDDGIISGVERIDSAINGRS